jgi:hypothetical protein
MRIIAISTSIIIMALTSFILPTKLTAQVNIDSLNSTVINKPFGHSLLQITTLNIAVNRFDAWVLKADWARVNPDSWWANIKGGFKSDSDSFGTNLFGHPYHGSMFYNIARANGYNFAAACSFTLGGTLLWEYFGETEPPSEIDLSTTFLGGILLGEITNRLSIALLKPPFKKKKGTWRKSAAAIVNPIAFLNSTLADPSREASDEPKIYNQLILGHSFPINSVRGVYNTNRTYINYSLIYGDLFEEKAKYYQPFDFFVIRSWLKIAIDSEEDDILVNFTAHAPIFIKYINNTALFSISQHFDYLNNQIFKIGALSVSADYSQKVKWHQNELLFATKLGLILFGSSKSEVVDFIYQTNASTFDRDYIYGRGFMYELEGLLLLKNGSRIITNYNNWLIYTRHDAKGWERSSVIQLSYLHPIYQNLSLGFDIYYYSRKADYKNFEQFRNLTDRFLDIKILSSIVF